MENTPTNSLWKGDNLTTSRSALIQRFRKKPWQLFGTETRAAVHTRAACDAVVTYDHVTIGGTRQELAVEPESPEATVSSPRGSHGPGTLAALAAPEYLQ